MAAVLRGTRDGSGPEGHFGLRGMRERAAQIGAQLAVKSRRAKERRSRLRR